jgi:flagellar hook-associated protein 3 FlgL
VTLAVGPSTYSTLDRLLAGVGTLRDQSATLQQQVTTGNISQDYAGLGSNSAQALDLQSASSRSTAYTSAIAYGQGKAAVMQDALTQITSVVSSMAANALTLTGSAAGSSVDAVAAQAKLALQQVVSLLNANYAGSFVFAGADTANAPVPSPDTVTTSGAYAQIGTQMAALATVPTTPAVATVIANTKTIASDTTAGTTIFSSYLTGAGATATPAKLQVSDSQSVTLDLPANRNVGAVSDPSISGTGSAINDIIRALSVVANATGAMVANPDFATMMKDAAATLTSAGNTVTIESGQVGIAQTAMTAATSAHASLQVILTKQLVGVTDVDMAATISRLQAVNTQLQASYNVLSMAKNMNLASYL